MWDALGIAAVCVIGAAKVFCFVWAVRRALSDPPAGQRTLSEQ